MTDIPTTEPTRLRAGDTWKWTRSLADYPAPAWTLKYRMKSASRGFEIVAAASGSDHAVTVSSATSAAIVADAYTWIAWVESGTEKYTVAQGALTVDPDYRASGAAVGIDARSHARKMLAAIEAWLESRDPGVAEYEVSGRRMKYHALGDLIKLRIRYQQEVASEEAAERLARGEGLGRRVQFRV